MMEFFDNENIIVEEYFKTSLTISNKPLDYIYQLLNINKKLKENSIYHNDYKLIHFYLKDGKIKLIDWNCVHLANNLLDLLSFIIHWIILLYLYYL